MISICIPTYNGEHYLQEALDSIAIQTYRNIEVIISDDASTDSTIEICKSFKESSEFPVHIYDHQPEGIGANWNHCIKRAGGQYIKFLFQDDVLTKDCLEEFLKNINYENMVFNIVICKRLILDDGSAYSSKWKEANSNLQEGLARDKKGNNIVTSMFFKSPAFYERATNIFGEPTACFYNSSIFEEVGLFNEKMKQILDLEFLHRCLKTEKILIIQNTLVHFRVHTQQTTFNNKSVSENEREMYIKRIPLQYFFFLPWKRIIKNKLKKILKK
ncbi:glycosyltransferase family 2 protein [Chryseobacterium wangxinyae]|uniref:glycosyltransferase family 2 protein n=1 Tax=Chryseobacterium sp. CY353 TaxID=2997334 RepID=UPI00226E77AF|nr:glycosyltransferase [Chryseobacterium sp. CY353]MCY0969555.1 glycosyltransferase [Chryseobacterium sp. CY353]